MSNADVTYLKYAMCNSALVATDELRISPLGSGFMAGEGIFETIRVRNSRVVLFDLHHARLAASLKILAAPPGSSRDEFLAGCIQVIAENSLVDGSVKLLIFGEAKSWSELILARQAAYTPAQYEQGFHLKTFPCDLRMDPFHGLKSLNYLRNVQARRKALAAGFDEAIFVNPNQQVLEGAGTNIFVVKDGVISTPPLGSGILPGVMRATIIQKLKLLTIRERDVTLDELLQADEVFLTNALLGIMPVAGVDGHAYTLFVNPVTRSMTAALTEVLGD